MAEKDTEETEGYWYHEISWFSKFLTILLSLFFVEHEEADDEWKGWNELGDPVLHIDLRDWADLMIIAPLSAHTLAKLAHGFCDDTVSCVVRAWDFGHGERPGKPLMFAPAMNTAMWQHPVTNPQLETICGFWNIQRDSCNRIQIIEPQEKKLACGEIGNGALASVDVIIENIQRSLEDR